MNFMQRSFLSRNTCESQAEVFLWIPKNQPTEEGNPINLVSCRICMIKIPADAAQYSTCPPPRVCLLLSGTKFSNKFATDLLGALRNMAGYFHFKGRWRE